ncbi:hypothetical protein PN36_33875 [Candidatus Thiomargarita nelsonii]|uniref:Uncharacterized protein n=1 Tax=Candidatus Thiomargarita nelsonii TaxID=1003181 RepID=A0A0A6PHK2_9GAMM|nr:hypothetical protein PN36_33875 [Candidatus Thiomargarita nelsonii]
MRNYDFMLQFETSTKSGVDIHVTVDNSTQLDKGELREYVDSVVEVVKPCITAATEFYAGLDNKTYQHPVILIQGDIIHFQFASGQLNDTSRLAAILNMFDLTTGSDTGDMEERLISSITIDSDIFAGMSMPKLLESLNVMIQSSQDYLTEIIDIEDDMGEVQGWPDDYEYRLFRAWLSFHSQLDTSQFKAIEQFFNAMWKMTCWTAFETQRSAREWKEAGNILFPAQISMDDDKLLIQADYPPVDFALLIEKLTRFIQSTQDIILEQVKVEHIES